MEDSKKRKLEESDNGELGSLASEEELKVLLEPLRKDQLIGLLVKLGTQYPSVAEEIRGVASADPVHRKLFVRGLSWETTSETLCAAFQVHGEIEEGAVITDKATGKSRGYGFITYRHMESTHRALKEPSKLIDGRLAVCNLACEGLSNTSVSTDQALRKIYIGGLSPDVSSEMLLNFFGRHGEIEEGSVAYDKESNKSRGFGFVTYKMVEAAKKALDDPDKNLGCELWRDEALSNRVVQSVTTLDGHFQGNIKGRNITVKLADFHKNRGTQVQIPAAVVPIAVPVPTPYVQPAKTHASSASIGYGSYSQPLTYPAVYPHTSSQYLPQQIPYPPVAANNDLVGLPAAAPAGASGNPYYSGRP